MKKPTIAITGASGFLGTELVDYFLSKGWRVIGLVRNPGKQELKKNLEWRSYDLSAEVSSTTLAGVDCLVHAAYIKFNASHPDAFKQNIDGAKNIITTAMKAKVKQLIFISTMSAHEDAISVYGKQKLAIEKEFLKTNRATVLRCGLIIGNGGIVSEMAGFMKSKHAVPLIGGGKQPLQIISVYDLEKVIYNVADRSLTGRFVAATPKVYEYREFYQALAAELRIRVAYIPVPYKALEIAFRVASALHLPLGVGEDNLKGLKMLTAMASEEDLKTIGVKLMDLQSALRKSQLHS